MIPAINSYNIGDIEKVLTNIDRKEASVILDKGPAKDVQSMPLLKS